MKYYETHFEDYIQSSINYNLHPELNGIISGVAGSGGGGGGGSSGIIPLSGISNTEDAYSKNGFLNANYVIYGTSGIGKYTQALKLIYPFSPSKLKYDKKMIYQNDKHTFKYRISDIHYEVDMELLGCNSKTIWNELFLQIIDVIMVKTNKRGIIICKNFHSIHNELLDMFYSYMQQYNYSLTNIRLSPNGSHNNPQNGSIQIQFILITEQISFIPNNILNICKIISIGKPTDEMYCKMTQITEKQPSNNIYSQNTKREHKTEDIVLPTENEKTSSSALCSHEISNSAKIKQLLTNNGYSNINNIKQLRSLSYFEKYEEYPDNIFNIICNSIIHEIENYKSIVMTQFRDVIYDILIYNIDIYECIWYVLFYFINKQVNEKNNNQQLEEEKTDEHLPSKIVITRKMGIRTVVFDVEGKEGGGWECNAQKPYTPTINVTNKKINNILNKTHLFFKQYNNNYRPIYHLESIFYYIIIELHDIT